MLFSNSYKEPLCSDPSRKAWVVEVHDPNGAPANHDFAILTLNQTIVDVICQRAMLLKDHVHEQSGFSFSGRLLDCTVNFAADPSDAIFIEDFHYWRLSLNPADDYEDAVLMFMSLNEEGTTGIYVKDLVARFAAQTPDQVVVMARPEHYEHVADAVEIALESTSTLQDKKILMAAKALCEIYVENEPEPYSPQVDNPS